MLWKACHTKTFGSSDIWSDDIRKPREVIVVFVIYHSKCPMNDDYYVSGFFLFGVYRFRLRNLLIINAAAKA